MAALEGILIVLDGIDGAGKTTQVDLLYEALSAAGETVICSKEPTEGHWGMALRKSAQTGRMSHAEELHAFIEDRNEHVATKIQPALDRGEIIILDRYLYSTIAYQGPHAESVDVVARRVRKGVPNPDVAFFIDLDPHTAMDRISGSRGDIPNHFEHVDYLKTVRSVFQQIAQHDDRVRVINGHHSIAQVYSTIVQVLVEGVLRDKRCAKSYRCDELWCAERLTGHCRWFGLRRILATSSVDCGALLK